MQRVLKSLLSIYFGIFLIGAIGFFFIVNLFNPEIAPVYVFLLLYVALFILAFGLVALVLILLQYLFFSKTTVFKNRWVTIRQSALLALLISGGFFLQSQGLMNLFTAVLMILALSVLELYFLKK